MERVTTHGDGKTEKDGVFNPSQIDRDNSESPVSSARTVRQQAFYAELHNFDVLNPGEIPNLADLAKNVGISREWARRLYNQAHGGQSVTSRIVQSVPDPASFDQVVDAALKEGLDVSTAAAKIHTRKSLVQAAKARIAEQEAQHQEELVAELHSEGLSLREIAKRTPLTYEQVKRITHELAAEGKIDRSLRHRRSPAEAAIFRSRVAELWENGLSFQQIADRIGEGDSKSNIQFTVHQLPRKN